MKNYRIAVIPGDGIGPEVVCEGIRVLQALSEQSAEFRMDFDFFPWGCDYYLQHQEMMPEEGLKILQTYDGIYLGAVGDPRVPDHISLGGLLLKIRKGFDEYINLRPIKLLQGAPCILTNRIPADIDMLFVRENSEGEYSGTGAWLYPQTDREVVIQHSVFSRHGCERVIRYAYEMARNEKKTLTSISKGNALNYSMVFWDQIFREVGQSYPDVQTYSYLVDAASMYMVTDPRRFQIVVASNLFGDILTDLGAAITGGMGIAAGANINLERNFPSMFEPIHGSAPLLAGKGLANPLAAIWAASQMLDHLGHAQLAEKIIDAIEQALMDKRCLTPDLHGNASTSEVGSEIIRILQKTK